MKYLFSFLCLLVFSGLTAQSMVPDSTFDADGKVSRDLGNNSSHYFTASLLLPDGKIITTSKSELSLKTTYFSVNRYNADGSFDFSYDCFRTQPKLGRVATCLALQANDKMVAAGYDGSQYALLRYLPDGIIDTTFGNKGQVIDTSNPDTTRILAVAVQPMDQKIVAVGTTASGPSHMLILRYLPDGQIDSTFSSDGVIAQPQASYNDIATSLVIQPDGKILVGGYGESGTLSDFILLRYNSNGEPDSTFGINGKVVTNIGTLYDNDELYQLLLHPDGSILACGIHEHNNDRQIAVVKYLPNGTIDTSFGNQGMVVTALSGSAYPGLSACWAEQDKFLIAGSIYTAGSHQFTALKFQKNGVLDDSFDGDGIYVSAMTLDNYCYSVQRQPDGKILLAGKRLVTNYQKHKAIMIRLNSDGTLDSSFMHSGKDRSNKYGGYSEAFGITGTADGKCLVIGTAANDNINHVALARFNADGSYDLTFSCDGSVLLSWLTGHHYGYDVALQMDGKILVSGYSTDGTTESLFVARLNSDGTPDSSFANNSVFYLPNARGWKVRYNPSDGKIYAGGNEKLICLTASGQLFPDFGIGGIVTLELSLGDFLLTQSGDLLIAGTKPTPTKDAFAVQRLLQSGANDPQFGTNGLTTMLIGIANAKAFSIAQQNDGRILVAGSAVTSSTAVGFGLVRLTASGSPDMSFGNAGRVTTEINTGSKSVYSYAQSVMVLNNNHILCGGIDFSKASYGQSPYSVIVAYNPNGTIDKKFASIGIDFFNDIRPHNYLLRENDGHLLVVGVIISARDVFGALRLKLDKTIASFTPNPTSAKIEVFPNPVSSELSVQFFLPETTNIGISLLDLSGRTALLFYDDHEVPAGDFLEQFKLPETLPHGVYVLVIRLGHMEVRRMVVK